MGARISLSLAKRLRGVAVDEPVDVVVELTPTDLTSPEAVGADNKVAWMRSTFEQRSEPVRRVIEELGGRVNADLWLDETLRVSMPRKSISALARTEGIHALDVPRTMIAD